MRKEIQVENANVSKPNGTTIKRVRKKRRRKKKRKKNSISRNENTIWCEHRYGNIRCTHVHSLIT